MALSSCNTIQLVEIERCTILSNSAFCTDKRLPEGQREYERSIDKIIGYQCTNISDYEKISNDVNEKLKELEKLRNQIKLLEKIRQ